MGTSSLAFFGFRRNSPPEAKGQLEIWEECGDELEGESGQASDRHASKRASTRGSSPPGAKTELKGESRSGAFRSKSPIAAQSALLEALGSQPVRGRSRGTRSTSSREKEDLRHIRSLDLDSLEMLPRELAPRDGLCADGLSPTGPTCSAQPPRQRRRERSMTPPISPTVVVRRPRGCPQMNFLDAELLKTPT